MLYNSEYQPISSTGGVLGTSLVDLTSISFADLFAQATDYTPGTTYNKGTLAYNQNTIWVYINSTASSGNAPPALPAISNTYWELVGSAGTFTWIAYATSADGATNFTTNTYDTGGITRTFIGIANNKTSAVESGIYTDYSWSKFVGTDGASAKSMVITTDRQLITFDSNGLLSPTPQNINLTANKQNTTATVNWTIKDTAGNVLTPSSYLNNTAGDTTQMTGAQFRSALLVNGTQGLVITATLIDGVTIIDTFTIMKVQAATNGVNAISGLLTNEAHTVTTDSLGDGGVYTSAGGTFKVYNGTTDVTGTSVTYSVVSTSNVSISIATSGVYSVTGASADNAFATLRAVYGGVTIDKVYSISKSKTGVAGPTLVLTADAQSFTYNDNVAVPASQTITLTTALSGLTGTVIWTSSPAVTLGGTGNSRTLSLANFGTNRQVTIVATLGSVSDKFTILRLDNSSAAANATVGATTGINLLDSGNRILSDNAISNTFQRVATRTFAFNNNSLNNWSGVANSGTAPTVTAGVQFVTYTANSADCSFNSPTLLAIDGRVGRYLRLMLSATATLSAGMRQLEVYFATNIYPSVDGSRSKNDITIPANHPTDGTPFEILMDMHALTNGGNAWRDEIVSFIRIDLDTTTFPETIRIHEISTCYLGTATVGAPPGTFVGTALSETLVADAATAKADALAAKADIFDIVSDGIFGRDEKIQARAIRDQIVAEYVVWSARATTFSVSQTAYTTAYNNLITYLNSVNIDVDSSTTIVRNTFNNRFNTYFLELEKLIDAVTASAATRASWPIITGTGKPADYADVTSANTAAAITAQGALATLSTADFATQVSGATKPANNATVGAPDGTTVGSMPVEQVRLGTDADIDETFGSHIDLTAVGRAWELGGSTFGLATDTLSPGGKSLTIGSILGNSNSQIISKRRMPYSSTDLYCVEFDIEDLELGTGNHYFGVACYDSAGNNITTAIGSYLYVAAALVSTAVNRRTYRGYIRGLGSGFSTTNSANPSPAPVGTVAIAPMMLIRYTPYGTTTGRTKIHETRLTKAASTIREQGALATTSTADFATQVSGSAKPANNADVTSANTAAAITAQGALATLSTADFATRVSGTTKPANNADVTAANTAAAIANQGALATVNSVNSTQIAATFGGGNLLQNSSFDIGSALYLGWSPYNNSGAAEPTVYSLVAGRRGGQAVQFYSNGTTTTPKGIYLDGLNYGVFRAGVKYVWSFYAKALTGWNSLGKTMLFAWNNFPTTQVELSNPALTTEWQRYVFSLYWAPGTVVDNNGFIYINAIGTAGILGIIDDMQIEEGDVATAYSPLAPGTATSLYFPTGETITSLKPGEAGANVTESRTAAGITGQAATATNSNYTAITGTKPPADADKTSVNTAAGITGQGVLATRNRVRLSAAEGGLVNEANDTWLLDANIITSQGTSAAISGQGALATLSTADFATRVSGATKPSDNATSDITLVATTGVSLFGNYASCLGTAGVWSSQVYSKESFTGGAYASATAYAGLNAMFGLNTDPLTDASYTSIDYAIHTSGNGNLYSYENGGGTVISSSWALGDTLAVTYDGVNIRYFQNGIQRRIVAAGANIKFYFDSSFANTGDVISNIRFGPLTSNDWSATGGTGRPADYADVTSANTAAGITGQGVLATRNRVVLGAAEGGLTNQANDTWLLDANIITNQGTASAITGQGALATQNTVDWATGITGKPSGFGEVTVGLGETIKKWMEPYTTATFSGGYGATASTASFGNRNARLLANGSVFATGDAWFAGPGEPGSGEVTGTFTNGATAQLVSFSVGYAGATVVNDTTKIFCRG